MKILVDIAIGILLYLLQGLLQIPIAFIFRDPFMGSGGRIPTLTYEYLIGAVLIFLITLVLPGSSRRRPNPKLGVERSSGL